MDDRILLGHGSGGKLMTRLIRETLLPAIDNEILHRMGDAAVVDIEGTTLAFTTDSYVISPLFFPGGDIGRLAICGTVNDLCVSGARPLFLSVGLIIEEGFPLASLERINNSLGAAAREAGVLVVTGDTKVVNRGGADGLFINTTGIGAMRTGVDTTGYRSCPGDGIVVNGTAGDHGIAVMIEREDLLVETPVVSDVAPLNHLLDSLFVLGEGVRFLRDPTRGGLATALNEFASAAGLGVELWEDRIPVRPEVRGVCELLGLDPLYVANEGKCVAVVAREHVESVLESWRSHPLGREAREIGRVVEQPAGKVALRTEIGGTRIVDTLVGEQLPRIC